LGKKLPGGARPTYRHFVLVNPVIRFHRYAESD
jgi:hypothetical protein